jgi:hypothetical protein
MSFHVNAAGNAGECRAQKGGCPFGSADEHFATAGEARDNFEKNMATETLTVAKFKPPVARFKTSGSFAVGEIKVEPLPKEMRNIEKITLPAGRYFVGDPCYTAGKDDQAWQNWCSTADFGSDDVMAATFNGLPVIGLHTEHGDGVYYDATGREYGVDAGLIGAVPEELIKKMEISDEDLQGSGHWVETKEPFVLERGSRGILMIGNVTIETDPEDPDYDPEDDIPWGGEREEGDEDDRW